MAKNDPAQVVSGAGFLAGLFTSLNSMVMEMGGRAEDLHRLTTPEGQKTLHKLAEVILRDGKQTLPLEEMLKIPDFWMPTITYLKHAGIETFGQLASKTEEELLALPDFKPQNVEDVKQGLAVHGMTLATTGAALSTTTVNA